VLTAQRPFYKSERDRVADLVLILEALVDLLSELVH